MNALEAFDVSRGLAFSTFAVPRIRGAMLDELRRQDHVPRSIRKKTRSLAQARESLSRIFGRPATDVEIAEHLGIDVATLWKWEADTEGAVHVSLDQASTDQDGNNHNPLELLSTEHEPSVEDDLASAQERQLLQQAIRRLKDQERIVLTLYYFEDLKLHEIAEVLHLTESRVSQIRSKALTRLRSALAPLREEIA
jgi:RNA polymerase sigma factor for flagellar operon FliA